MEIKVALCSRDNSAALLVATFLQTLIQIVIKNFSEEILKQSPEVVLVVSYLISDQRKQI